MPIVSVSERAKMLLAQMINEGEEHVVGLMKEEQCEVRDILEVGMYVRELGDSMQGFKEIAQAYGASNNYQLRLYARTILMDLGLPLPRIAQSINGVMLRRNKRWRTMNRLVCAIPTFVHVLIQYGTQLWK